MLQPCIYAIKLNCKCCDVAYFKACKKFLKAHYAFLSRNLHKFTYHKINLKSNVVWSRDENLAKSAALQYAIKCNSEVKVLTLSQVISLTVSNTDVEGKVYFIEYRTKMSGEVDKLTGVLSSFVDKATFNGACVVIFISPSIPFSLSNYSKV